jgi:hypothetical protein
MHKECKQTTYGYELQDANGFALSNVNTCSINVCGSFVGCAVTQTTRYGANSIYDFCTTIGGGISRLTTTQSVMEALTVADIEANATDRLVYARTAAFGAGNEWSSWANSAGANCAPTRYQARSAGSFQWQNSQWMVNVSNWAHNSNYALSLEVWRSNYAANAYSLYAYANTNFATSSLGFASLSGDTPLTRGYDTYVSNANVFPN